MEAPNIDAARRAAGVQARNLQVAAHDSEQFENDLIAGGLRLDQAAMAAVRRAMLQLGLAAAAWDRVVGELGKHAQGEEYASSGHAASTGFLGGDGGNTDAPERGARPSADAPGAVGPRTTGDMNMSECPTWCKKDHPADSAWHSGETVQIGGEVDGSWYALAGLIVENGEAKIDFELCDGDDDTTIAVNISLVDARKISQALAGLAKAGHLG